MAGHICIGGHLCALDPSEVHACEGERCLVQHWPHPVARSVRLSPPSSTDTIYAPPQKPSLVSTHERQREE